MALPPGITPKTVTVGIASFFDGSLAEGTATITAPVNVVHTPTNRPIFSSQMSHRFVDGETSFNLAPTDAPGLNRVDWTYKLNVVISGALVQPDPIYFTLPAAGPDEIDLDSLVTVPSSAGTPIQATVVTSVNGQTGDVTVSGGSGTTVDATTTVKGIVELATTGETTTGTDTARAVTPAGVKAATDANSTADRARANHTGTQAASTITGLAAVATSGAYADLTGTPTIPAAYTDEQARDVIGTALVAGAGLTKTVNDAGDTITLTATATGGGGGSTETYYLRGVNAQGLAGNIDDPTQVPGTLGVNYWENSQDFYDFIASRGHTIVRLDFLWERVQPTLGGGLSTTGVQEVRTSIQRAGKAGLKVLLDMKNYGRYWLANDTRVMFGDGITEAWFADAWTKIATAFADEPAVVGWGLMNEPYGLPAYPSSFTSTGTIHAFDTTVEDWVGAGGTTASYSSGSLLGTETNVGGTQILTLESPQASGFGTYSLPVGSTIELEVRVPASTSGTLWQVRPAIVNNEFQLVQGTMTTVPKGATSTKVYMPVPASVDGLDHRHLIVDFTGDGITGSDPVVVEILGIRVGTTTSTGMTYWKQYSQAAVTAIRATGDTRDVYVAGDQFGGAWGWSSINGDPWITDPADAVVYEAHVYLNSTRSGQYEGTTYAAEQALDVAAGWPSLEFRVLADVDNFCDWLALHGQRGFIGEIGWPSDTDAALWNAVAAKAYRRFNEAGVGATFWAAGEHLSHNGGMYNSDLYWRDNYIPQAQAEVVEHPDNMSRPATLMSAARAIETTPRISPQGEWDFAIAPTVGGTPLGGDSVAEYTIGTGNWWTPSNSATGTGALNLVNLMVLAPLRLPAALSMSALAVEVSTAAGAGGLLRAGIYGTDANGLPDMADLLVDLGTQASTATGVKTFTPGTPTALPRGLVWFALVAQVATCTIRTSTGGNETAFPLPAGTSPPAGSNIQVLNVGGVSAGLPTSGTAGAGTTLIAPPKVYLKAA